jgi:hypothetical protein
MGDQGKTVMSGLWRINAYLYAKRFIHPFSMFQLSGVQNV